MAHVAVLCGGKGSRLGYEGQKCLIPTAGRPFLHWKLDFLADRGASAFTLLVNYRLEDVIESIGDNWAGVPVDYVPDRGVPILDGVPFVHFLTYGDSILDVPLANSLLPYVYVNDEHPRDAGLMLQWGRSRRFLRKYTPKHAYHVNTRADWQLATLWLESM